MLSSRTILWLLAVACLATGTVGVLRSKSHSKDGVVSNDESQARLPTHSDWVAAGPGRIEPISGEIRIAASAPGRLADVLVLPRNKVSRGALLATIDDSEQLARVVAAKAEVSFRQAERDAAISAAVASDRRSAEDNVYSAEDDMRRALAAVDQLSLARAPAAEISAAQGDLAAKVTVLANAQKTLDASLAAPDGARPTRTDSALAVARAELGVTYAALEKTRVRAPRGGTVLHVFKSPGDMASPATDDVLVTVGDLESLRVRIEVDESEIGHITTGQHVVVRCDAFPGRQFNGSVSLIAASTRPRQLATQPSSLTATDMALEVIADLEAGTPFVPGMRVDAFFEPKNSANEREVSDGTN